MFQVGDWGELPVILACLRIGAENDKGLDSHRSESDKEERSESMETISKCQPPTSPKLKDDHRSAIKKTTGRYYSDYSYLDAISRQERRRIEQEILKGHRPGELIVKIIAAEADWRRINVKLVMSQDKCIPLDSELIHCDQSYVQ